MTEQTLISRPLCTLRRALGAREECPGPACPFWDDDGCTLGPIDIELLTSPALACHLLDLRVALERAEASDEQARPSVVAIPPAAERRASGGGRRAT
jgi:hypothetical protein